jgi:hypothetical protein
VLDKGTKLTVETNNSIYQIVVVDGREITIMGGMTQEGDIRFPKPIRAMFIGSTWGGAMMKPDWIGQDMRMEIIIDSGDDANVLNTSGVKNIEIESPNGKWSYSMDWNK